MASVSRDEIKVDGDRYLSAAQAAADYGVTRDFIARLARHGKAACFTVLCVESSINAAERGGANADTPASSSGTHAAYGFPTTDALAPVRDQGRCGE